MLPLLPVNANFASVSATTPDGTRVAPRVERGRIAEFGGCLSLGCLRRRYALPKKQKRPTLLCRTTEGDDGVSGVPPPSRTGWRWMAGR